MEDEGSRYKRWRLFERKPGIVVPQVVREVNLVEAYRCDRDFRFDRIYFEL